jgi:membrane dipeptidase
MYRLGVRYMTLTWSVSNELGDSSGDVEKKDVAHHGGLSALGREAIAEMNRLGMLVDVSHVADSTFSDAIAVAKAPLIASHSSCRALTDHPRNMTDEMLRAVAKNGGVVMVNFFSAFVDDEFRKALEKLKPEEEKAIAAVNEKYKDDPSARTKAWFEAEREIAARVPRPPLKSLIDHIEHAARVAGIDPITSAWGRTSTGSRRFRRASIRRRTCRRSLRSCASGGSRKRRSGRSSRGTSFG